MKGDVIDYEDNKRKQYRKGNENVLMLILF